MFFSRSIMPPNAANATGDPASPGTGDGLWSGRTAPVSPTRPRSSRRSSAPPAGGPRWLGPGLTETFETPRLLEELGLSYVLDWTNDDQPYPLTIPGMLSVPYSVELNDLGLRSSAGRTFSS